MIADAKPAPKFQPGQLVRHRRYGYRGVVVAVDHECRASVEWHQSNRTQPDRDQPWYHVLVDGGTLTTYPAQENLEADPSGQPIDHPMVDLFFTTFIEGHYDRNDRPWPNM